MNTRRATPTGKPLVATDLARDAEINDKEKVNQAKLLYKLLIKAIPRMRKDIAPAMVFIDIVDGDIQLILLLIVDKKIEELDPKFGLGKSLTHVHDHLMGSLLEIGYLTEEDNSEPDTEPDSDEESLPYYMTKGTVADIFSNAESVTESESIEPTDSESNVPTEPTDSESNVPTEPTDSEGSGSTQSTQSWVGIDSMVRRIPTGVIRRFLENAKLTEPAEVKPEPITDGSPMDVGGYANWTDSSEREPPAPHPDDKWRYN
ncbi:hypothetical protein B484DRAFT_473753 [Ochromonadaceae sp. CCMP2298]|nr:hypothetical protein B484DRAFT_473753 [Ochromonadaceae sp. CCMP2298]